MNSINITWINLTIASLVLLIPIGIFYYYKTGLVKPLLWSFFRMTLQLIIVGLYLKYIFELNSVWINLAWVVLMSFAAAFTIVKRSSLILKKFFIPLILGIIANLIINIGLIAYIVIGANDFFNARYIIPITGMFIGNSLNVSIISLRSLFQSLVKDEERYKYNLISGANKNEALFPFISDALKDAFSPSIASTATIGLIWLPGMMTGQILGGSDPMTSIKYQIMIMVGIFSGNIITVVVSILLSKKFVFNKYDLFDKGLYSNNEN